VHSPTHFYLSTAGEFDPLSNPRECQEVSRLCDAVRDDYMLVEIDPPLSGQQFGLGDADVTHLILSSRHEGHTLYPVSEWPAFVYVARVVDPSLTAQRMFRDDQVELIAWGTLFRSFEEAAAHARKFGNEASTPV
jgi:hypothetical protein